MHKKNNVPYCYGHISSDAYLINETLVFTQTSKIEIAVKILEN